MVAAPQKRRFVVYAKEKGLSERSACRLVRLSRTVARYRVRPKRYDNDHLVERLQEIARKKRRRGYRLAHTDEFTRESLALEVSRSFTSEQVCQVLERLLGERGKTSALRMDNGPEFVALALKGLCHRHGINAAYIEPGKPWQNGFAESFVSRLRDEFLDGEALLSLLDARTRLGTWRRYYNEERLHSRIGYQTPQQFAASWGESGRKTVETKESIGAT
ncbi:MAG: integrase core domain-containing protein [Armatimonadota bacterium]